MDRSDSFGSRGDDSWTARDDNYRRRSPPPSDRQNRNGRNRSRSPRQIDRYQPGRRDEGHRRRSPPPVPQGNIDRYVPGQDPPAPVVNPLPNPLSLDYQVGFNWFAEWWRKDQEVKEERERQKTGARRAPPRVKGEQESKEDREKERASIQAAYDTYKEKLQVQQARAFVAVHRGEEWFKERYDPEVRDPFRHRLADHRREIYNQWQQDLENNVFDGFTLEGIYKSESNGLGGVVEKEEGEATAAAEIQGVGDLLPCKGGDLRDEAAQQPALLIKTIAPHVSREKMEAFCKEHLGEGDGGFHWLSLSDPNPQKKCHRIGWVMLNPGGEEDVVVKHERGDGRDADGDDGMEEGEDAMDATVTEGVSQSTADKALSEINGKSIVDEERGNFQCHVGVHVPPTSPRKKALWDLFSAPERIDRDLHLATRIAARFEEELGEDVNGVNKIEEKVEELRSNSRLETPANQQGGNSKPPKSPNGEDAEEGEDGEMDEDEEGLYDEETDDEDLLTKKKKLDLTIEYLRRVFSFCLFCVFESDSVHELTRKCPGGHLRRPRGSLTSSAKSAARASTLDEPFPLKKQESSTNAEDDEGSPTAERSQRFNKNNKSHHQLQRAFNWVKTYEDKIFQILEPENADLVKLGGRPVDEALEEELKKFVKQEDEAKFRCKVPNCTKLFKGESFWRKHVEKRHAEWFDSVKKDLDMLNAYVLDPAHITPSRSDANSNGHFPSSNSMPTGTPRGFNLTAMASFGLPPNMAAGISNGGGFPGNFGQYPVSMPGFGGMTMDGGVGPMRRGGGRMNSRMGNPYDRQGKDARNQRWGAGGRLSPPRGGRPNMMMGGGPRFPDAQPAAVGPKEAVAGRSLKSYEDLDAVETGGDGALDY